MDYGITNSLSIDEWKMNYYRIFRLQVLNTDGDKSLVCVKHVNFLSYATTGSRTGDLAPALDLVPGDSPAGECKDRRLCSACGGLLLMIVRVTDKDVKLVVRHVHHSYSAEKRNP